MNDKKFSVLAAIALTACMILGLSGWTVESARAVDLDQECSLTVSPGEAEDLQNAECGAGSLSGSQSGSCERL